MNFTIITPSFNQLDYLKWSVASVADQVGSQSVHLSSPSTSKHQLPTALAVHHHVQDGGSTDGTVDWLRITVDATPSSCNQQTSDEDVASPNTYQLTFASEADSGMYDALNKGVDFAKRNQVDDWRLLNDEDGRKEQEKKVPNNQQPSTINLRHDSVVAWLNCDEQYLPGTLEKVASFFKNNPNVDILFGGMLMVDEKGKLLACRKAMPIRRTYLEASYLYNYSCAMFFRESIWQQLGGFDTSFKNAGDEDLIRRALKFDAKTAVLDEYQSTFTYSGTNLSSDPAAVAEHERLKNEYSVISRFLKAPINLLRIAEKFLRGGHVQRTPVEYAIYAGDSAERTAFRCENPSCKWPDESKPYLFSHRLKTNDR